ncbi:MAG: O-antigen ligase family protein [Chloroflexaceae bacterium]
MDWRAGGRGSRREVRRAGLAALVGAIALGLGVASLPLTLSASLIIGAVAVVLSLLSPIWALYLLVLSVPVQELWHLPGGLTVTQAALLLAAASLVLPLLAFPERPLIPGPLLVPLAIFVWTLGLSSVFTPFSRVEGLRETARWSTVLLVYVLALQALRGDGCFASPGKQVFTPRRFVGGVSEQGLRRGPSWRVWGLLVCLLAAPAATGALGLVQFALGLGPESFGIGGGRVRAYGTIGQPNSFAGYMNQSWPLAVSLALFALVGLRQGAPRRPALLTLAFAGVAALLTGGALIASFSRGGWIGAVAGMLTLVSAAFMLLPADARALTRRFLVALAAVGLALLALSGGGLLSRAVEQRAVSLVRNLRLFDVRSVAVTPENFAIVDRMAHLQAGWNMFRSRPLLGVGPGNYSIAYERTPAPDAPPFSVRPWYRSRGHAHNYYLHIAAEAGVVGLAAYLLLIGAVMAQALRALRAARDWLWSGVAVGGAGVVVAVAIHNLFENLHVLNMGLHLGAIWALLYACEASRSAAPP